MVPGAAWDVTFAVWAVAAFMSAVTASMLTVTSSIWAVTDAVWAIIASMHDAQALCGLLHPLCMLDRRYVGCHSLYACCAGAM